jgi:hypothetical protein
VLKFEFAEARLHFFKRSGFFAASIMKKAVPVSHGTALRVFFKNTPTSLTANPPRANCVAHHIPGILAK